MLKLFFAVSVCAVAFCSCTKSNSGNPVTQKDSTLITLLSSVTYYDNIYLVISRKDSLSYDPKGHLVSWINYSYENLGSSVATMAHSFVLNEHNQISGYSILSTDFLGDTTRLHYNVGYDNQGRIANTTASPPAFNPSNEFNVTYHYGPNSIVFNGIDLLYDTMLFADKNMVYRSHRGIAEVRGSLHTFENFEYSGNSNPFYDSSLANVGALFFSCFTYSPWYPETDFLGDVLSKNLVDSIYFQSRLYFPTDWGYYKYNWVTDNMGKVTGGNVSVSDSTRDNSGYKSLSTMNYHIQFNYKTQWLYK